MVRFGPFEIDLATGDLRRNGLAIKLQEQPLRILQALLESPGELVTREQLRDRLWPCDTFVDFERSLNAAVAKLRQALGDSAEQPLYVETVARKGYRFVAPLTAAATQPLPRLAPRPILIAGTAVAVTLLLIVAAAGGWQALHRPPSPDSGAAAFTLALPEGTKPPPYPTSPQVAVSPDGRTLAIVASVDGIPYLFARPIATEKPRRLEGSEGATLPFWSPDSREIAFFANGKLKKTALAGGSPQTICDAAGQPYGGTWGRAGMIVFSVRLDIYLVPTSGGQSKLLLSADKHQGEVGVAWPSFLPDGRRFVFFVASRERNSISIAAIDDPRRQVLFWNNSRAVFSAPDYLLFVRQGSLVAQHWDLTAGRERGPAETIVEGDTVNAASAFTVSEDGVLVYRTGLTTNQQLVCYGRDGNRIRVLGLPGPYVQIALSPDEKSVLFHALESTSTAFISAAGRLWLMRLESEAVSRHYFGRLTNSDPVWSPDSRQVAFAAFDELYGPSDVMVWTVGETSARVLISDGRNNKPDDWMPDGTSVLCRRDDRRAFLASLDGSRPQDAEDGDTSKDQMRISPDGRMVAFGARPVDRPEVFVARMPGIKARIQVSAAGGMQPVWTKGGRELIYATPDNRLMSIEIRNGPTLEASAPRALFRSETEFLYWASQYGVSTDGERLYILEPSRSKADAWHVLTRWQEASKP